MTIATSNKTPRRSTRVRKRKLPYEEEVEMLSKRRAVDKEEKRRHIHHLGDDHHHTRDDDDEQEAAAEEEEENDTADNGEELLPSSSSPNSEADNNNNNNEEEEEEEGDNSPITMRFTTTTKAPPNHRLRQVSTTTAPPNVIKQSSPTTTVNNSDGEDDDDSKEDEEESKNFKKKGTKTSADAIDWSDKEVLWDLTVEKLRNELRRRGEYVAGSKRVLIDRILGRDLEGKNKDSSLVTDIASTQEQPEQEAEEKQEQPEQEEEEEEENTQEDREIKKIEDVGDKIKDDVDSADDHPQEQDEEGDDTEPLEGPKGDASLWSNKQLKHKLKSLGYSTSGKRTTLLKRFRSVMHIQRQRELAALSVGHSLADVVPSLKTSFTLPTPDQKKNTKYVTRRTPKRRRLSFHKTEESDTEKLQHNSAEVKDDTEEQVKPLTKRRRFSYHDTGKKHSEEIEEDDDIQDQYSHEDHMETVEEPEKQEMKKEKRVKLSSEPHSALYTLSRDDLALSSNLIRYMNPDLANRKLLGSEDLEALESLMTEEYCSKGTIKDRNLAAHLDMSDIDQITTIHIVYSPGNNVGSNAVPQQRRRSRKQQPKLSNLQLQPHQLEPGLVCSLSGIEKFVGLKRLICIGQRLTNISPISYCTSLEQIFLNHNFISVIPSLKNLKNLSAFSCSFNQISDISSLSDCHSLEYLNLSFNGQIDDITPLASCSKLIELDLSGNMLDDDQVEQFTSFTCQASLIALRLNCNQIEVIRPIAHTFLNLEELSLNKNQIYDISSLIRLRKLNELDVQGNSALFYSIQVYNASRTRQMQLQERKQKEMLQKRGRGRPPTRQTVAPTVTAAEEDVESLLTGTVYDTFAHEDGEGFGQEDSVHTWMQYGKVNMEVLECLMYFGTRCAIDKL